MATRTHRVLRFAALAGMTAMLALPTVAAATSRRHVDKPDEKDRQIILHGTEAGAPEIDISALAGAVALLVGGVEIVRHRREKKS